MFELIARGSGRILAVETSILPDDMCIAGLLLLILKILVYGLGAAATVGVVVAGIQYMTARDNESQVAAAKTRLLNIVIGLVAWAVMWAVMNWLIPGGMSLDLGQDYSAVCPSGGGNNGGNNSGGSGPSQGDNSGSTGGNQGNNQGSNQGNNGGNSNQATGNKAPSGATIAEVDGKTYAFPIVSATKANVTAGPVNGVAQPANRWAHWPETGYMVDLAPYDSNGRIIEGAKVAAITSGTILWRSPGVGAGGDPYPSDCATVAIKDDNGGEVDYMHLKADSSMPRAGTHVNAGDIIGEIGPSSCTNTVSRQDKLTASHVHIQFDSAHAFRKDKSKLQKILDELYGVMTP